MKLINELLTEKMIINKVAVVYISEDSNSFSEIYDAIEEIFSLFGYKEYASLDKYITKEELEDKLGFASIEDVSVWAKSKPSKNDVLAFIKSNGIIFLGG